MTNNHAAILEAQREMEVRDGQRGRSRAKSLQQIKKAGLTTLRDCRLPKRRRPNSQRPPPRSKDFPLRRRVMIPSVPLAKR